MSQAVVSHATASSHRVLSSNAGDARAYAEQLLNRICRKWGVPLHEVRGNRHVGRRLGENICIHAVRAEFLRDISPIRLPNGWTHRTRGAEGLLSSDDLGAILNLAARSIRNLCAVIDAYQERSVSDVSGHRAGRPSALSSPEKPAVMIDGRLTGYDRASLEELHQEPCR